MLGGYENIIIYSSLFISLFFEVFLLITYLEKRSQLRDESRALKQEHWWPTVTIIVPCFNEEQTILKTIFSLLKLNYPKKKLRIIVVDDGSTDKTLNVLSRFKRNPQIEIFSKENGGKHTAVNFGLEKTTSELVGCLDADSFVDPEALVRIVRHFEDPSIMAVTPAIKVHDPKGLLQLIQRVEYGWGVFLRKMLSYLGAIYVTPGPFSIFRTEVFRKLGGYKHAHLTEDFEMALRMQTNHYQIVNAHDAHVYTVTPNTMRALYKQRVRWTYGFLNNVIDYRFLLFKKEYGNIGLYILPMATLSVFSALYFAGVFLWYTGKNLIEQFEKVRTVGIEFAWSKLFTFDWFFLNTDSPMFLVMVLTTLSVIMLIISRILTEGRFRFSLDLVYFLTLYVFIVPLWLSRAVYTTIVGKKVSWR